MPIMMVVINDVMAYMFGFFLGKNSLIQLSPKKTWEGYIGGGVSVYFFSVKTFMKLNLKGFRNEITLNFSVSDFHSYYYVDYISMHMPI